MPYDYMRALGLKINGYQKYSIHATTEPESIGYHESNGCIRMRIKDMLDLYPRVPNGTTVIIDYRPEGRSNFYKIDQNPNLIGLEE